MDHAKDKAPNPDPASLSSALEEAKRMIVEIEEIAQLGRWEWDIRTERMLGSDRLYHIYGLDPASDSLSREHFINAVVPEDREHVMKTIQAVFTEGKPYNERFRVHHPDGSVRWVYVRARLECDGDGNLTRMVGTTQDITDRERIQEELRRSESLFREMAENIREVFWLFDWKDQKVIYASPAYETIWGRSLEELLDRYEVWGDSIHPEDREQAEESFNKILETGGGEPREYRIVRPAGDVRWISDRGFVIRDESGEVQRIAGIAEDVTDKKAEEEERQALQEKIQHSQKLESLGVLAGGIAHEFNNLLMAILGNTDLALETMAPEATGREFVEKIGTTAQRAAGLTNQMLAYSGKGRFLIQPIQLDKLVGEMAHLLETVISKKASLQFHFPADLPIVEADASQIRQIVMNLITNASEALEGESGTLRISTGVVEADRAYLDCCYLGDEVSEGSYVFLEVSDTGCGMDQDTCQKIFDPFFTTKFTGRGLGLAAVLGIVRGHDGTVKVYSEKGKGSSFKVLLPSSGTDGKSLEQARGSVGRPAEGATILVVEDDPDVLDVTANMLTNAGFKVLEARNGQEGVDRFSENREQVDLVLLDMTMPVMDGEEAFQAIRRIQEDVRVVLSSGYNEQDATNRFAGKGLAGFIQKPYRASDLLARVNGILQDVAGGDD